MPPDARDIVIDILGGIKENLALREEADDRPGSTPAGPDGVNQAIEKLAVAAN